MTTDDFRDHSAPSRDGVRIGWQQQADFEGPIFRGDVRHSQPGNLRLAELLVAVPVSRPEEGRRQSQMIRGNQVHVLELVHLE